MKCQRLFELRKALRNENEESIQQKLVNKWYLYFLPSSKQKNQISLKSALQPLFRNVQN